MFFFKEKGSVFIMFCFSSMFVLCVFTSVVLLTIHTETYGANLGVGSSTVVFLCNKNGKSFSHRGNFVLMHLVVPT